MNKYENKVTALIAAADELLSVLPHDSNALQTVKDEIESLQVAIRAINKPTDARYDNLTAYVFVEGGAVMDILDRDGNNLTDKIHVIDYDNAEHGACPVCDFELQTDKKHKYLPCGQCGYDGDEHPALECAVKLHEDGQVIHTSEAPEVDKETVTLIVASYDWECPHCSTWNTVQDNPEKVTCEECGHTYAVDSAVHIGK